MAEPKTGIILWDAETAGEEVGADQQLLERFVAQRDEAAFAGLVHRHGRSVWGVCRRVLRQHQDIEDAFQATFLILARKAGSIRKGEAVGSWLYGVAHRTAMRARHTASRRQERERKARERIPDQPPWGEAACQELQRILDDEVLRLPEKLRGPFVLCCLEGMSKAEAARELDCKEGTVSSRLAAARKLLKSRLARKGITLSAALTACDLVRTSAWAAAPTALVQSTPGQVMATEAGLQGGLSSDVVRLANGDTTPRSTLFQLLPMLALLCALLASIATMSVAAIALMGWSDSTEAPIVWIEPETFVPPGVVLGTPVGEQVLTVAFSPDGQRLVTAGAWGSIPGQLKIWNVVGGHEVAGVSRIPGVRSSAFAPDGRVFATGDFGGAITLRDAVSGDKIAMVKAHDTGVNGLAYSPDGTLLASAGLDRTVKLWSASLEERKIFTGHTDFVLAVAFFHDGKTIVTGGQDRSARIWDVDADKEKFTLLGHRSAVESVAVSTDDKVVATASSDQSVRLWNAQTGALLMVLKGDKEQAFLAVTFSPDGVWLAAAGRDGTISLWNAKTWQPAGTLEKHDSAIWALAFSREGVLASGSADRTAKLWHLGNGWHPRTLNTSWSAVRPVLASAYAPNGKFLAVATSDKTVHIRDAKSGDIVTVLAGHTAQVNSLAFSPDGKTLASGSSDDTIKLWDWVAGNEIRTLTGHPGGVHAVAFMRDGPKLASAGADSIVRLWDPRDGKELAQLAGHTGLVQSLAFAPEGTLASGGADMKIKVWDVAREVEINALPGHTAAVRALAYSSAGVLASASDDNTVKLWEPSKGTERFTLSGHGREVLALAFSPEGRTLVSGGQDGTARTWEVETGRPRGTLKRHNGAVTCLAMHPHGHNLVTGSLDTLLVRWQAGKLSPALPTAPAPKKPAEPAPAPVEPAAQPAPKKAVQKDSPWLNVLVTGLQETKPKETPSAKKDAGAPKADGLTKKLGQEYYQSLKGLPPEDAALAPFGPGAAECVKFEPDGLRITLPQGDKTGLPTGIRTGLTLKGDFELTVGFEILQEPAKADGGPAGTRVSLMAGWEQRGSNCVKITRGNRPPEGSNFVAYTRIGARDTLDAPHFPDGMKSGRVRVVRVGTVLSYYVAEGSNDPFELMHQTGFVADDLENVRIAAATGSPKAALDVRLTDLRIRADGLVKGRTSPPPVPSAPVPTPAPVAPPPAPFVFPPNAAAQAEMARTRQLEADVRRFEAEARAEAANLARNAPPPPQAPSQPPRSRTWLIAAIIVSMVLMAGFALNFGLWLFLRQRRRPAEALVIDEEAVAVVVPEVVMVTCGACGKALKTKPSLAGKKVRCPKCGKGVLVPAAEDDEEDLPVV